MEGHDQERAMMSEIYSRGPIVCSMAVPYALEYDYRGGIYIDHSNSTIKEIDHDVEVRPGTPSCLPSASVFRLVSTALSHMCPMARS